MTSAEFPMFTAEASQGSPGAPGCGDDLDTQPRSPVACCERGVAAAREERRKLREWGYDEILGCTARLVPLAFESQGRWGQSAINELERLARLKGGLLTGSPHEAANVAAASLTRWRHWLSVVLQRGECGCGACRAGQASQPEPIDADLLQGRERVALGSRSQLTARTRSRFYVRSL